MTEETKKRILHALNSESGMADDNAYRARARLKGGYYSATEAALAEVYEREASAAKKALDEFKSSS